MLLTSLGTWHLLGAGRLYQSCQSQFRTFGWHLRKKMSGLSCSNHARTRDSASIHTATTHSQLFHRQICVRSSKIHCVSISESLLSTAGSTMSSEEATLPVLWTSTHMKICRISSTNMNFMAVKCFSCSIVSSPVIGDQDTWRHLGSTTEKWTSHGIQPSHTPTSASLKGATGAFSTRHRTFAPVVTSRCVTTATFWTATWRGVSHSTTNSLRWLASGSRRRLRYRPLRVCICRWMMLHLQRAILSNCARSCGVKRQSLRDKRGFVDSELVSVFCVAFSYIALKWSWVFQLEWWLPSKVITKDGWP